MAIYGGGGIAPSSLASAIDVREWTASRLGRFAQGERASSVQQTGCWVGPTAGLDAVR
jgi:hypothetical protein